MEGLYNENMRYVSSKNDDKYESLLFDHGIDMNDFTIYIDANTSFNNFVKYIRYMIDDVPPEVYIFLGSNYINEDVSRAMLNFLSIVKSNNNDIKFKLIYRFDTAENSLKYFLENFPGEVVGEYKFTTKRNNKQLLQEKKNML